MQARSFQCAAVLVAAATGRAAAPVLTHLHPAAIQAGTTADLKLAGKFDPWPCRMWADVPGLVFTPGKDAGKFSLTAAPDTPPGPHLIRAINDQGASAPIAVVVAATPQVLEKEPNDDFRSAQPLDLPAVCNGRMDKSDDVDSFAVTLKQGQTLVTRVDAYLLAAGYDAMLRLTDADGHTLAFNHDWNYLDPFIAFTAPRDGRYIVQTMGQKYPASTEVRFAGGDDCVYRLHVSTDPVVRHTWPLAVPRATKTSVRLEGWNLTTPQLDIDAANPPPWPVTFSDIPELTETADLQTLTIPSAVSARIETPGDEDRFSFAAAKGEVVELAVSGTTGSEIDAWLKVFDKDGKELSTADDDGASENPRLVWTAPADGTFTAVIGDLTGRGGTGFYYRLSLTKPVPAAAGTIATHAATVTAGKTSDLKVSVAFTNGYNKKLKLSAKDLPAGITATEPDVPEKAGEVTFTLTAAADAARSSAPFRIVLREVEGGREEPVRYQMISTSENNGVPQGYRKLLIDATDLLWLTVIPAEKPAPAAAPPAGEPAKK